MIAPRCYVCGKPTPHGGDKPEKCDVALAHLLGIEPAARVPVRRRRKGKQKL